MRPDWTVWFWSHQSVVLVEGPAELSVFVLSSAVVGAKIYLFLNVPCVSRGRCVPFGRRRVSRRSAAPVPLQNWTPVSGL